MEKYNYFAAVCDDVRGYINYNELTINKENRDEVEESLNDLLWVDDSVTGNASGSYTFNRWHAEENLCHNLDLLAEAASEFGCNIDVINDPEGADVTIRCYLLGQCIGTVLDEICK